MTTQKIIKLFWQLLLFPVLCIPYHLLNQFVIVKWLGCGCSKLDNEGNMIDQYFNANDFTLIFWCVIALTVIAISLFNMRKFARWYSRLLYIVLITVGSVFVAIQFYYSMQWR